MKHWFVGVLITFIGHSLSQRDKIYRLDDLTQGSLDSVYVLNLSREKLSAVPSVVYRCKNLERLDLSRNKLQFLGDSLPLLTSLTHLNLSANRFIAIPHAVFSMTHLKVLNLGMNDIEKVPDLIEQLIHLEQFILHDNAINSLSEKVKALPELRVLDLQGVMYGHELHRKLVKDFSHCKLYIDPPCSCMD
ncbi:MAG: leucine-rich repeat domain-containing protein [Flavobacteriales bacterium]